MLIHKKNSESLDYEFACDVKEGLERTKKKIKSKYFYDHIGSQLFEKICLQPEYYLTRTELAMLDKYSREIMKLHDHHHISILELGSGSSTKTRIMLKCILKKQNQLYYFPIDISHTILYEAADKLSNEFSGLYTIGIFSDYIEGVRKVSDLISSKDDIPKTKLILFLGSSIGNFEPKEAISFFRAIRARMENHDSFLVGFDLHKDPKILEAAYNDKAGITAKFNLNILARINRDLGGKFDLGAFSHYSFYNENKKRIEMYLISKNNQKVHIHGIGKTFTFKENERIHTENSYKYTLEQIRLLAKESNFKVKGNFIDEKKWFDLALLSPA
jgi:dimethylhistidine N-methyltransferase